MIPVGGYAEEVRSVREAGGQLQGGAFLESKPLEIFWVEEKIFWERRKVAGC